MPVIERPNKDAIIKAADIFRDAMRPFIVRNLRRARNLSVEDAVRYSLQPRQHDDFLKSLHENPQDIEGAIDIAMVPPIINGQWRNIFSQVFNNERNVTNTIWTIKDARDKASHTGSGDLDDEYTRARLTDVIDVLGRINAPEEQAEVERIRTELVSNPEPTLAPDLAQSSMSDDMPTETSAAKSTPNTAVNGRNGNLKPWRDVIHPNQDVASGAMSQAEFAANLQAVLEGRANDSIYGNPTEFFRQTYITPGMQKLLINTLQRLFGGGGNPVIQTKTGFGGGKTHSLIALYHLLTSPGVQALTDVQAVVKESGVENGEYLEANVAVLDCTELSPTDTATTDKGDPLNTLWGEMAWQLGGQDGYDIIGEAAKQGTAPGGRELRELLTRFSPCVILVDELVAYARNTHEAYEGSLYTFAQSLTQSVAQVPNAMLVVTLPEHDSEAGGVRGEQALQRLEQIFGRIESLWEPLAVSEAFAVVRRRLFGDLIDEEERDRTCGEFARLYTRNRREYPPEAREAGYIQRLKDCYPIHPEIFDRMYSDWSSLIRFQQTRGVLRLLSVCVNRLYTSEHRAPLIMPADLPLHNPELMGEFDEFLSGNWRPVISEASSEDGRADMIDRSVTRFQDLGGVARRIARTIMLGSAPHGAVRGISRQHVHLGVVRPGQSISTYNEALDRMNGSLYYLYGDNDRYYFHAEENLNKVAADRAAQITQPQIDECVVRNLKESIGGALRHRNIIVCPDDSDSIKDSAETQLVILPPSNFLPSRSSDNATAEADALAILLNVADARPRVHRNAVLFLTAKNDDIRTLNNATREHLAWDSIVNGAARMESLKGERERQARNSQREAEATMINRIVRAFRWALAPAQAEPSRAEYTFTAMQTDATNNIVDDALDKFAEEEVLVSEKIAPSVLASSVLNPYVWNTDAHKDHIDIDALWEMMTGNVYMPRLRDKGVLDMCVSDGVVQGVFGYADSYTDGEYINLRYNEYMSALGSMYGLLVNADMAELVKEEQRKTATESASATSVEDEPAVRETEEKYDDVSPPAPKTRRITVRQRMSGEISLDDTRMLSDEIVRNLREDGGEVNIEIVVTAHKPDGFSENIARAIGENSKQLGLDFEPVEE